MIAMKNNRSTASFPFRFPSFMAVVSPKEAVVEIVKAQRQNIRELSIPTHWLYVNGFLRYVRCEHQFTIFTIDRYLLHLFQMFSREKHNWIAKLPRLWRRCGKLTNV